MGNIILLALAAAVYPTLLAAVIVLLARQKPARLLSAFLAGGMLISITAGLIIVFALDGAVSTSNQKSASPTVDLIAGILSIILAAVLWKRERDRHGPPREAPAKDKDGPSWTQRTLGKGSVWAAFGAGLILNLPGIWYLDALKDIAEANEGGGITILWILVFLVIMFALAELPLIGYAVDPDGTRVRVQRFQSWLSVNGLILARWAAALIGAYLTITGIAGLA
jgi:hypothetical protein